MEGSSTVVVDNVMNTSGLQAATAAAPAAEWHGSLKRKMPKKDVEYVVVSYKDLLTNTSFVSAMPTHWMSDHSLWFPPKSENSQQMVNKATWKKYRIRQVYKDTMSRNRAQVEADSKRIRKMEEKTQPASSSEIDAPQRRVKSHNVAARQQPPSAPVCESRVNKPKKQTKRLVSQSDSDTDGDNVSSDESPRRSPRKRQRISDIASQTTATPTLVALPAAASPASTNGAEQSTSVLMASMGLPRRSPRKHEQHTNISSKTRTATPADESTAVSTAGDMSTPQSMNDELIRCPVAESTPKKASTSGDGVELLLRTMQDMMVKMNSTLQSVVNALNDVRDRLDQSSRSETSSVANISVQSASSLPVLQKDGYDTLTAEQRTILFRTPLVSTDMEQNALANELNISTRAGRFFGVLVSTLKDRAAKRSDVKKTANSVLRAVYEEAFLAERVTMAGYKKNNITNRDYGTPDCRYIALGRSLLYWAIFEAVKGGCQSQCPDDKIQQAIRDGINTVRLHYRETQIRETRREEDNDELREGVQQRRQEVDTDDEVNDG